ncbi:putative protein N(5)-glutamine methyltransferase [Nocardia panacis]|uniref:peptide chain release factor N(5)-glutamine methyltransferase n=1 Tax=Nocardia panacis TaxID=2340916 RepID=A0A3A4JRF2_9NOCA|nr:putative protein N(5)-glutamine methyltransferase [Nocardia panacis]RJO68231.1 putative protein N(5)-glutamine methyltransferase [Nocardia panacis]
MGRVGIVDQLRAAGCVFAEEEARLLTEAAGSEAELAKLVARRVSGTPLEYVVGWAEFRGLRVRVWPGVFVPRRRTAFLVELAAAARPVTVLDLCCGSGALGLALVREVPGVELVASDIDPVAVDCARVNLEAVGAQVYRGDLFESLPVTLRGRVDVLLANVPYVPTEDIVEMPPEAREHEPRGTLDGGPDGLDMLRRVADGVLDWLAPGGMLLIEISAAQAESAVAELTRRGLAAAIAESEEYDATAVVGVRR